MNYKSDTAKALRDVEDELDAALERLIPVTDEVLLARRIRAGRKDAAAISLATCNDRSLQELLVARMFPRVGLLVKRAYDLNLRWNIEEGLY